MSHFKNPWIIVSISLFFIPFSLFIYSHLWFDKYSRVNTINSIGLSIHKSYHDAYLDLGCYPLNPLDLGKSKADKIELIPLENNLKLSQINDDKVCKHSQDFDRRLPNMWRGPYTKWYGNNDDDKQIIQHYALESINGRLWLAINYEDIDDKHFVQKSIEDACKEINGQSDVSRCFINDDKLYLSM